MKKILLIISAWLILAGCTKDASAPISDGQTVESGKDQQDIKATISYNGDPTTDGFGWVLQTTPGNFEIPTNLSADYQKQGLIVIVSYKVTDKLWPCRCANPKHMVEITAIR